jgi:hypothetical protein
MTNDYKFQELVRILDATLARVDETRLHSGHNALYMTRCLFNLPGMQDFISPEFKSVLANILNEDVSNTKNVRAQVKKCLMFPEYKYPPWTEHDWDLTDAREKAKEVKFKIMRIHGTSHIYAECVSKTKLADIMMPLLVDEFDKNTEHHITIVSSNIVAGLDELAVDEFLKNYDTTFSVNLESVKSTTSNDWSVFSECYVVAISSSEINSFIQDFNTKFALNIKPSLHSTFAVKSRDLFQ